MTLAPREVEKDPKNDDPSPGFRRVRERMDMAAQRMIERSEALDRPSKKKGAKHKLERPSIGVLHTGAEAFIARFVTQRGELRLAPQLSDRAKRRLARKEQA